MNLKRMKRLEWMKCTILEYWMKRKAVGMRLLAPCRDLNRLPICLKDKPGYPSQDLLSIFKNGVWVLLGLLALHHLPRRISTYLPVDLTGLLGFKGQSLEKRANILKCISDKRVKKVRWKDKLEWKVNEEFGVVPNELPSMKGLYRRACLSDLDLLFSPGVFRLIFSFCVVE